MMTIHHLLYFSNYVYIKLSLLFQDPVLFSGTLRRNLDPFNYYSDDDMWLSLEQAHMKTFVSGLTEGLNYEVGEGGEALRLVWTIYWY